VIFSTLSILLIGYFVINSNPNPKHNDISPNLNKRINKHSENPNNTNSPEKRVNTKLKTLSAFVESNLSQFDLKNFSLNKIETEIYIRENYGPFKENKKAFIQSLEKENSQKSIEALFLVLDSENDRFLKRRAELALSKLLQSKILRRLTEAKRSEIYKEINQILN